VELQARRVIQQNQQVLLKMQQEQELAERRLGDSERQERKIGEPSSDPPNLHVAEEDVGMIHYKQSDEEFWADYNKNFINELIGIGVYMAEVVLFAILYKECMKRSKPDVMPTKVEEDKSDLFAYGLFDTNECCGRDRQMCFCAFCCTWIRWADTASNPRLGPFLEYYPAVFIASLLCAVSVITFGLSMPLLGLVVVLSRSKIRKVYNLESGTCRVLCHDCLVWWCCSPCAIVQEARQVEYVDPPGYPSGPGTGFASA
jgi:Cys-rich protein (TIGR01571 family)